jgi:hypothetical protein|tara:strand:- start:178 stop:366 length:189 start_codon:yes stop_codon:yes gene_type:complete
MFNNLNDCMIVWLYDCGLGLEGCPEGLVVGELLGLPVGIVLGATDGIVVGCEEGRLVGCELG